MFPEGCDKMETFLESVLELLPSVAFIAVHYRCNCVVSLLDFSTVLLKACLCRRIILWEYIF